MASNSTAPAKPQLVYKDISLFDDPFYVPLVSEFIDGPLFLHALPLFLLACIPLLGPILSLVYYNLITGYLALRLGLSMWVLLTTAQTDVNYKINNLTMLFLYPVRKLVVNFIVGPYFFIGSLIPIINIFPNALWMALVGTNLFI